MTIAEQAEVRRTSVGTKVLMFGFALLAVLGSFWTIVWFIRAYVEAPRIGIPATMALAARDSTPVVPPAATVAPTPIGTASPQPANATPTAPAPVKADATPVSPIRITAEPPPAASPITPAPVVAQSDPPAAAIADRWLPITPAAAPPPPAAEPAPAAPAAEPPASAPAALVTTPDGDPPAEAVAERSVPAIAGPAPLPRRKPTQIATARSRLDPPLPRPRPDGPAPQSVWTAVPTSDERFNSQ